MGGLAYTRASQCRAVLPPREHLSLSGDIIFLIIFIYLMDLFGCTWSWLRQTESAILTGACRMFSCHMARFLVAACRSVQGSNPGPLHWERRVLATGAPGSPFNFF